MHITLAATVCACVRVCVCAQWAVELGQEEEEAATACKAQKPLLVSGQHCLWPFVVVVVATYR